MTSLLLFTSLSCSDFTYVVDYLGTSLVVRFETIKMILSNISQMEWKVYQFDVKSYFFNGFLYEMSMVNDLKVLLPKE